MSKDTGKPIVNIEEFTKNGQKIPESGVLYLIRIDRETYVVDESSKTGRELLQLAGKQPIERYQIDQKFRGGQVRTIGLDESVSFCAPGIERFMTLPLDQNEGQEVLRRDFLLPRDDIEFLDTLGNDYELLSEVNKQWLLVRNWPVPDGYTQSEVSLAILIAPGYPTAQLDMVYFSPPLSRTDKKPIGATNATEQICGESWQRWSRHRTSTNPWRAGIDCISTHVGLIKHWLQREFSQ